MSDQVTEDEDLVKWVAQVAVCAHKQHDGFETARRIIKKVQDNDIAIRREQQFAIRYQEEVMRLREEKRKLLDRNLFLRSQNDELDLIVRRHAKRIEKLEKDKG